MPTDRRPERKRAGSPERGQLDRGHGRPGRLMCCRDIQRELGVRESAAWRIIRTLGRVVKIGRSVYVYRRDVEGYLERNTEATGGG